MHAYTYMCSVHTRAHAHTHTHTHTHTHMIRQACSRRLSETRKLMHPITHPQPMGVLQVLFPLKSHTTVLMPMTKVMVTGLWQLPTACFYYLVLGSVV